MVRRWGPTPTIMYKALLFLRRHGLIFSVIIIFIICALIYAYILTRPSTDDAFVIAKIRPVSSRVGGFVNHIYVKNNQYVRKGQKLFSLDPRPFILDLDETQAKLDEANATYHALTLKLAADKQQVAEKKLAYETAKLNAENAAALAKKKEFPESKYKNLVRTMEIALAAYNAEKVKLNVDEAYLLQEKYQVNTLKVAVRIKQLNLSYTTVYALSNGSISNLNLSLGTYVEPGKPLFAFVDTTNWWVQANIKETELTHVRTGDLARIYLRIYPHHLFKGKVVSMAWAVQRQLTDPKTFLPKVINENQWFLLPQRFPVLIKILNPNQQKYPLHVGASADVRIIPEKYND